MILFDTSTLFMIMKILFIEVVLLEAVSIEWNALICLSSNFNNHFYVWILAPSMDLRSEDDDNDEHSPQDDDDDDDDVRQRLWKYDFHSFAIGRIWYSR